jgi:hypothetical protein
MPTSSVPVKLKASDQDRITWTATPSAPLLLTRLAISRDPAIDPNSVTGTITPGAPCTLFAGDNKFATLKANCGAAGLKEAITFDAGFAVSDVTPSL